ncbi:hypothetical protein BB560_002712 [Smittium megazygosporum]|uniref:GPI ethanolamine phosphate transferase 2 n=1 Tax=Smittium megazygosporum TaxID=133381 RepID=A0A2T9ZE12_9FUNG|nr:hypothetical protein BB560_002712 [Smittium megazygosporum]
MLQSGKAIGYTAKATVPTVTMPRLKALMSGKYLRFIKLLLENAKEYCFKDNFHGTIPGYTDAVLNLIESHESSSESEKQEDSIIWQLVNNARKKVYMFGDDTWLRLFPGSFSVSEGTTSFYVQDTVEVDLNVTRHLDSLLDFDSQDQKSKWDVLVLHYLGLDHIGHLDGPNSVLMAPKQKEMDNVVEKIYTSIEKQYLDKKNPQKTLFILLGDHGMNEIGNHGGNSPGETSAAMVFISPSMNHKSKNLDSGFIQQIDLVPTLCALMGIPTPQNNIGIPIKDLLTDYSELDQLKIQELNSLQLKKVAEASLGKSSFDKKKISETWNAHNCDALDNLVDVLECRFELAKRQNIITLDSIKNSPKSYDDLKLKKIRKASELYFSYSEKVFHAMSKVFGGYDINKMLLGIGFFSISLVMLAVSILKIYKKFGYPSTGSLKKAENESVFFTRSVLSILVILSAVSVFSTSFIEEEHVVWFYICQTLLIFRVALLVYSNSYKPIDIMKLLGLMFVVRILKGWNNLGIKWAEETQSFRLFLSKNTPETEILLLALLAVSLIVYAFVFLYCQSVIYPRLIDIGQSGESKHLGSKAYRTEARKNISSKSKKNAGSSSGDSSKNTSSSYPRADLAKNNDEDAEYLSSINLLQHVQRACLYYSILSVFVYKVESLNQQNLLTGTKGLKAGSLADLLVSGFGFLIPLLKMIRAIFPKDLMGLCKITYVSVSMSGFLVSFLFFIRKQRGEKVMMEGISARSALCLDVIFTIFPVLSSLEESF